MDAKVITQPTVLNAEEITGLPAVRLQGLEAARSSLLWRAKGSAAGVMQLDPGGELQPHCHPNAHHHFWMLEGQATVSGQRVGPGTYVHIPAGVEHGIVDAGSGCRFFYLYLEELDV
jgi:quercetin dioxygenase-like cupin family protein